MLPQPFTGFTRIPYAQRCRVRRGRERMTGVLCNISVLGAYATLDIIPKPGELVEIAFPLPRTQQWVRTQARVIWQNLEEPRKANGLPPGCGMRFESLSPADETLIAALVEECKKRVPMALGASTPKSGFVRVPYIQRCRIEHDGKTRAAVVCNLSVIGVYVTIDPLLPEGARIKISFLLPGDPRSFRALATVRWLNPEDPQKVDSLAPGCGLRFDDLPEDETRRLERVVFDYCSGLTPAD